MSFKFICSIALCCTFTCYANQNSQREIQWAKKERKESCIGHSCEYESKYKIQPKRLDKHQKRLLTDPQSKYDRDDSHRDMTDGFKFSW